jgi:hypothetical protein
VPLSDGAGEVAAIGEGVTRVKIGRVQMPPPELDKTSHRRGDRTLNLAALGPLRLGLFDRRGDVKFCQVDLAASNMAGTVG